MDLKSFLSHILFFLLLAGCTPPVQNTLLTDGSECTSSDCSFDSLTKPSGTLQIQIQESSKLDVGTSNLLEVSGSCSDMGQVNNQILAQVYHNSEDLTVSPYIDNSISTRCITNASGLPTTDTCFFVSQGPGALADTPSGVTTEFPRCINGRFSFQVKLGNVTVVSGEQKKYYVRAKLRVSGSESNETNWVGQTVTRGVGSPMIAVNNTSGGTVNKVYLQPFKYKSGFEYAIRREVSGYGASGTSYSSSADITVYAPFAPYEPPYPAIGLSSSVIDYSDNLLISGVTFNYYSKARIGGIENNVRDQVTTVTTPMPSISGTINETTNDCSFTVSFTPSGTPEWAYESTAGWSSSNSNATSTAFEGGPLTATLNISDVPVNQPRYVAVRFWRFDGSQNIHGPWSNELTCVRRD